MHLSFKNFLSMFCEQRKCHLLKPNIRHWNIEDSSTKNHQKSLPCTKSILHCDDKPYWLSHEMFWYSIGIYYQSILQQLPSWLVTSLYWARMKNECCKWLWGCYKKALFKPKGSKGGQSLSMTPSTGSIYYILTTSSKESPL